MLNSLRVGNLDDKISQKYSAEKIYPKIDEKFKIRTV